MGVIVHSGFSQRLAASFYEKTFSLDWAVIPHFRVPAYNVPRKKRGKYLGLMRMHLSFVVLAC